MLDAISPYIGFTAAGLALLLLAVDRHCRAQAIPVRIAVGPDPRSHRAGAARHVVTRGPGADVTQRLPVIVMTPSSQAPVTPPLPPAAFRRQPVPPQPPLRPSCRPPDRPANPRSEARLITPWGDLSRLPGSDEPGIVPSTLGARPTGRPGAMSYLPAT